MARGVFERGRCLTVVIPAGQSMSAPVLTQGMAVVAALFPAVFAGSSVTILESPDGINWGTRYERGADETFQVAASKSVPFWPYLRAHAIRIVSNATEGSERIIRLYVQEGA